MLSGCFSSKSASKLVRIIGTVKAYYNTKILDGNLKCSAVELVFDRRFTFQLDKDHCTRVN